MQSNRKTVTTLLMVALVALAGIGAFAGSTTAATDTLAGDGTDEVTGFTANETNDIAYSISSDDGTNGFSGDSTDTLYMNVTYNSTEYAVTEEAVSNSTATSQTVNITNDQLSDLPGGAGESVNVTVNAWGEGTDGSVNTTGSTFDATITFDNTYAVASVDDSSATIEETDGPGFFSMSTVTFWSSSSDPVDLHTYESTVGIDGSNTTVTVYDETTNGSDAYSDAIDDDIESGDVIYGASVGVNGTPVKAFYDSADSDKISDGDTYAVYDSSNNVWTVHTGDAQDGATSMDVYLSSQSYTSVDSFEQADLNSLFISDLDMGVFSLGSNFGWGSLSSFSVLEAIGIGMIAPAGGASLAGLALVAGRTRLGA